ncbi:MAG: hypothetical protein AUH85_08850 [Chloroflexi bacterium 13_1_40CM_4_68_4]|nr:MAG: hypothetical protein AUH85_08850 [Chloroflexi bacterium 13_1_40CM_4_68_4]
MIGGGGAEAARSARVARRRLLPFPTGAAGTGSEGGGVDGVVLSTARERSSQLATRSAASGESDGSW